MPETEQQPELPGHAHSPSQLHTAAGYVEGNSESIAHGYAYQAGEQSLHDPIAAGKASYLSVVEQQLADLFGTTDFTFDGSFLEKPEGAILQEWKAALLCDPTHSVAEIIADSSDGNLGVKLLL